MVPANKYYSGSSILAGLIFLICMQGRVCNTRAAMIQSTIHTIHSKAYDFPDILRTIPDPPERIYVRSQAWPDLLRQPRTWVAVVGSRQITPYGKAVTTTLVTRLVQSGVGVVSGLAIGVDGYAHRAALEGGGHTIAVLAGGLDYMYPRQHQQLAAKILGQGGALLSEYPPGTSHYQHQFIARNRLVSGLCQAVLIIEATEKSGTLHTAAFALDQGRDVLVVPGNITSPQSQGTNRLIKTGATPVTSAEDLLQALGLERAPQAVIRGANPEEQAIIEALLNGQSDGAALLEHSHLEIARFNQTLTMLEITGKIRALGANTWALGA